MATTLHNNMLAEVPSLDDVFYLTELLGLQVFDLKGRRLGPLIELALVPLIDPVRVDRYLVRAGDTWLSIRHDQVGSVSFSGIHLIDERLTPYHSDEYMLRLKRDLLDQQIIDAQGRKVVRVNDVTFVKKCDRGREQLALLEIDIGLRSILRRVLAGVLPARTIRTLQSRIPPHSIRWEFCSILESDPQRRVRLNLSNRLLEKMHPADLADIVEELSPDDREAIFSTIDSEVAAETLSEVDPDIQASIIESLDTEKAAAILEEMAPHEVADVLGELEEHRSEEILEEMQPEDKEELEELLEFRDDTAGGLMHTEFLALGEDATVAAALERVREHEDIVHNLANVFLVDHDTRLLHAVPLTKLLFAAGNTPLRELATDRLLSVTVEEKQDRIAELFDKYNLLTLPVVDDEMRLAGIITVDDIVSVLREKIAR